MSSDTESLRTSNILPDHQMHDARAFITPGIAALGAMAVKRLVQTITTFDDFYRVTDPDNRPECGVFEFDGIEVYFQIEASDQKLNQSIGASGPTARSIILMLADQYDQSKFRKV